MKNVRRDEVVIAGDWHGDAPWAETVVAKAKAANCDVILQVGDFGIWPGRVGMDFLAEVDVACFAHEVTILVTPGNHEDWDAINYMPAIDSSVMPGWGEIKWFTDNIGVIPRGHRFQISGSDGIPRTFLSLGGAPSIDKDMRTPGVDWWADEMITWADVHNVEKAVLKDGPVDYMLTHDAPEPLTRRIAALIRENGGGWPLATIQYCTEGRQRLTAAFNAARPKVLFHGHYHLRETAQVVGGKYTYDKAGDRIDLPVQPDNTAQFNCRIESLSMEATSGNAVILDIASGKVKPLF